MSTKSRFFGCLCRRLATPLNKTRPALASNSARRGRIATAFACSHTRGWDVCTNDHHLNGGGPPPVAPCRVGDIPTAAQPQPAGEAASHDLRPPTLLAYTPARARGQGLAPHGLLQGDGGGDTPHALSVHKSECGLWHRSGHSNTRPKSETYICRTFCHGALLEMAGDARLQGWFRPRATKPPACSARPASDAAATVPTSATLSSPLTTSPTSDHGLQ